MFKQILAAMSCRFTNDQGEHMKCPQCNAWSVVKDTRKRSDNTTYRRYECANLHRFSTIERIKDANHN